MMAPLQMLAPALLLLALCATAAAAPNAPDQNPGSPWPATDALGRDVPTAPESREVRPGKYVGIFYFLWHDNVGGKSPHEDGPYDIARILDKEPGALSNPKSPYWGPIGMYHYWGKPVAGYYQSDDEWVLRRHAHQLAEAGVDTLIFDTTNAATYKPVYMKLCEVFMRVQREGGRTPKICFMVNTQAGKTARTIYEDLYKPGAYKELWFQWRGKPLLLCDPADADPELRAFFTLRRAHWPFEMRNTKEAWHWEATYPQPYGFAEDPGKAEQVNVSVAQNLRASDGQVTNMSNGDARGRSFHEGKMDRSPGSVNLGLNFQEQWKRAFELDPPFVMITGWNEWIAGRWGSLDGPLVFVDQFDQQYSRDIEPADCGHHDNYYYQMAANIRRWKGAAPLPTASGPKSIRIGASFEQWSGVRPLFSSPEGDTRPRDHAGAGGTHYRSATGRNDIIEARVARDKTNVYFLARTADPLTPRTDPNWMWLLLRTGGSGPAWEGYQYIINRTIDADGSTWLERCKGGWSWEKVAKLKLHVSDDGLQVAVPRKSLNLRPGITALTLDFKWIDNAQKPGDILDTYVSGDAAPLGRFRYRYTAP